MIHSTLLKPKGSEIVVTSLVLNEIQTVDAFLQLGQTTYEGTFYSAGKSITKP